VSQDDAIILAFKVAEVASVLSIAAFILFYSRWASWWSNAIGRTIVIKDLLLIIAFIPSILSLFFRFSRLTSHVAAWLDVAMIGLIAPVMIWRTFVFWRIHRDGNGTNDEDQEAAP
jgi:hypothetical protein